jgi:DNA primase
LNYQNINHVTSKNELRFSREEGTNPTSVKLSLETLKFVCFSTNDFGNIYTLVMKNKNLNFPQALNYVAEFLGLSKKTLNTKIKYPFSGFYKGLMKEITEPECSMKTYNDDILKEYTNKYNLMFFKDGIDFDTQKEFNVGFDLETLRITVPEYTLDGKLCGIMGRLNDTKCDKHERWIPIIPCSRSLTLYGYHKNYAEIQKKGLVVIGESEKFVQQLHSMGCKIGLSLCGCDVSEVQAKYIKSLMTNRIILALDEGLDEEQIRSQAEKLIVNNTMFQNKVGYIYDKDNVIIPKGSKGSPSDFGKRAFSELCKSHVVWIN